MSKTKNLGGSAAWMKSQPIEILIQGDWKLLWGNWFILNHLISSLF